MADEKKTVEEEAAEAVTESEETVTEVAEDVKETAEKAEEKTEAKKKEAPAKKPAKKAEAEETEKRPEGKTVRISGKKQDAKKGKTPAAGQLKVTLAKALAGHTERQIAVAHSLGLRRVGDATIQPDSAATQGKISKIGFLLKVDKG